MAICTFLTDFGTRDYYVAALKGTILRLAGSVSLVDISHELAPGDVDGGAFLLQAARPSFPPGTVHLAVVDPGVGSQRRMLVLSVGEQLVVAPDNGLGVPGRAPWRAWSVERTDLFPEAPGSTFHGRDRFAPIAAHLLRGGTPPELGPEIEDPVRLTIAEPTRRTDRLEGRVRHIDRYGNLVTDIPSSWLTDDLESATVGALRITRRVDYYAALGAGESGVIPGSLGTLELSERDGDLAARGGIERGNEVHISLRRGARSPER